MKATDPSRMSSDEVLAEVGELLAAGFQRHVANRIKSPPEGEIAEDPLDGGPEPEAQCVAPRGTPK